MAESHSLRGLLGRKQRKQQKTQPADEADADVPEPSSHSATSSLSSPAPEAPATMEGMLKKRAAKMPVMHDRYCVATWEMDNEDHKCVMLRSYKSRKNYDAHPERPTSVHQIKCISDWDGKTGFHRYQHAFTMETRDKKLFQCVAPTAAEKDKWVELMAIQSAFSSGVGAPGSRDMRLGSVGSLVPLRRTASVESADTGKPRAYTSGSIGKKPRAESDANAAESHSTDSEGQGRFPGHDGLFRSVSGDSANSADLPGGDKSGEPADWGLYGESGEAKSKYEVADDTKPVLLDKELLDSRGEKTKTLATDSYLFEDGNKSRFGAVVVKGAEGSGDEDDVEFVDAEFEARQAREENEKQMRRRAQKLESNRDLYAEMAAARLKEMRKDARHPKKSSHSRPSDVSDEELEEDQSIAVEGDAEDVAELEEMTQRRSSRSRRSSKSHKKSSVSSNGNTNSVNGGYASGDDEEEEEEEEEAAPAAAAGMTEAEREEAEELRQLKKKYRAERRAKKRLQREKEEEERTALQAAELARAHREEQRAREEEKAREEQEKRDKKERKEMKEKLKREKAKQRQAEAELRRLVELKQAEEERRDQERREKKERKDKKKEKKAKKKEKYTTPAERIQKKEERDAERAAAVAAAAEAEPEVSNALVVVDPAVETAPTQPASAPMAAPAPAAPAPTSTSAVQTAAIAVTTEQVAAPASAPATPAAPVAEGIPQPATAPPQVMPMYQVAPPPFVPTYPAGPQSMPAYGLAATFGAFPPQLYPAPYSYGAPVAGQPGFVRPNMGFVAGLSAMGSFRKAAGPEPAPLSEDSAEPMIGPQLPTPEERATASSASSSAPSSPPPPPSSGAKLTNLPELPDVVGF